MSTFLLDSNIIFAAEPSLKSDIDDEAADAAEFIRRAKATDNKVFFHPASLHDIDAIKDSLFKEKRRVALGKYEELPDAPVAPRSGQSTNRWVDDCILESVERNAVGFAITKDGPLRHRARERGLGGRILSLSEGLGLLTRWQPPTTLQLPAVHRTLCHSVSITDPIFVSLCQDYPGFMGWFISKCQQEHRPCLVVWSDGQAPNRNAAALAILKHRETSYPEECVPPVTKLCTFKVAEDKRGFRLSELVLKQVFAEALANGSKSVFVTVFKKHQPLVALFEELGFVRSKEELATGEYQYVKRFIPDGSESGLSALDEHIRFGPPHFRVEGAQCFLVPITETWHRRLFPEAARFGQMFPGSESSGNGIRKAYLCKSSIRRMAPGDVLAFYQSKPAQSVQVVGVIESVARLSSLDDVTQFVGTRTVYTKQDLSEMLENGTHTCILFRHAKTLKVPMVLDELLRFGARSYPQKLTAAPISIGRALYDATSQWP